jgi:hypothetical protein
MTVPARTGDGFDALLPLWNLYTYMSLDRSFNPSGYLSNAARPVFDMARTSCEAVLEPIADGNHLTAENVLKKTPDEAIAHAASYERYPIPRFARPVFIGSGLADVTALPEGQYDFVMAACSSGSIVETHLYPGRDHSGTVNTSLVDSVPFVRRLLAGQTIAGNCASVRPPIPERSGTPQSH